MRKKLISLLLLVGIFMTACGAEISSTLPTPSAPIAPPSGEQFLCVRPESDNGISWDYDSRVCYDTQAYTLDVEVLGDLSSNQTVSGNISGSSVNGIGSVSGRMWTDGKGVLPVMIVNIHPTASWVDIALPYILKTTDLKTMGLPVGSRVKMVCSHDVEASSPSFTGQTLTQDRITDELDNCRLVTGNFIPGQ